MGHCWTTGGRSWVKWRKKRVKEKCTIGTVLYGLSMGPSGPFEKAKGGERQARPETAAMGSRVGRWASAIHLVKEINFADKVYYTYLVKGAPSTWQSCL